MNMNKLNALLMILMTTMLFACGGGGGEGAAPADPPPAQLTTAVLKLSTSGTLPTGALIGGVDVTVTLPSGATVKSTAAPMTDAGVVAASGLAGSGATVMGTYSAESGATPGTVRVLLADPDGLVVGEFATVNCEISAGSMPAVSGFTVQDSLVTDLNGAAIIGMTVSVAAALQ